MPMGVVQEMCGPPTSTESRMSGKQFNPFYFGRDRVHYVYYYKRLGHIVANNRKRVIKVVVDPSEDGYP